jgi:hypothetical protein
MLNLCAPAIIYLIFSITQILIDLFKGLNNTALMKCIVTIMVTLLLNILCERGLNIVSWIIVFIPFILMTVIVSMLLYIFGLDAANGSLIKNKNNNNITTDKYGNIVIYDPNYMNLKPPLYYKYPNLIVTNPDNNVITNNNSLLSNISIPSNTSSPAYQS